MGLTFVFPGAFGTPFPAERGRKVAVRLAEIRFCLIFKQCGGRVVVWGFCPPFRGVFPSVIVDMLIDKKM